MVKTQIEGEALYIELNNPSKGNCLSPQMILEIKEAFLSAGKNIKKIHLTGAGKNFCTGADLNWMYAAKDLNAEDNIKDMTKLTDMYKAMHSFTGIISARVQGNILGGGMGLVAACDVVVAEKNSKFSLPEKKWGLTPGIITPLLARKIGPIVFNELSESSRAIFAEEAISIKLINAVEDENTRIEKLIKTAEKPKAVISDETFKFFTEASAKMRHTQKFIDNVESFLAAKK